MKNVVEIANIVRRLAFDIRTNMTSITRYVRHDDKACLNKKEYEERHEEYRRLADDAVNNILKCINENAELHEIEQVTVYNNNIGIGIVKYGEWVPCITQYDQRDKFYRCSECGRTINVICGDSLSNYPYCHCGTRMDGNKSNPDAISKKIIENTP